MQFYNVSFDLVILVINSQCFKGVDLQKLNGIFLLNRCWGDGTSLCPGGRGKLFNRGNGEIICLCLFYGL